MGLSSNCFCLGMLEMQGYYLRIQYAENIFVMQCEDVFFSGLGKSQANWSVYRKQTLARGERKWGHRVYLGSTTGVLSYTPLIKYSFRNKHRQNE